jgi:hypothetical protein
MLSEVPNTGDNMNSRPVSACSFMLSQIYLIPVSLHLYKDQTISLTNRKRGYIVVRVPIGNLRTIDS